jgi:NADH dehydrogenase (ubiquinone) 1 alpha subcomplex subunit 13
VKPVKPVQRGNIRHSGTPSPELELTNPQRNLPFRGFRPGTYLLAMGAISAYGCYVTMQGIKERREMAREKIWTRIHLTPMLQAEADRDDVRRYFAAQAREKELMKDVKGWKEGSVYNSDRYVSVSRSQRGEG